jgi:hypothetical protein
LLMVTCNFLDPAVDLVIKGFGRVCCDLSQFVMSVFDAHGGVQQTVIVRAKE